MYSIEELINIILSKSEQLEEIIKQESDLKNLTTKQLHCIEIIHGRRSIRRYLSKEIPDETLQTVLEAARWSPSWANTQCWDLVLVSDQKLKQDLGTQMWK